MGSTYRKDGENDFVEIGVFGKAFRDNWWKILIAVVTAVTAYSGMTSKMEKTAEKVAIVEKLGQESHDFIIAQNVINERMSSDVKEIKTDVKAILRVVR